MLYNEVLILNSWFYVLCFSQRIITVLEVWFVPHEVGKDIAYSYAVLFNSEQENKEDKGIKNFDICSRK